jgi:ATP-binding cassette subfamily B protein
MTGQSVWAIMQAFFSVSPVMIYILAGYLLMGIANREISPGVIVAFTTLQSRLYFPIGTLLRVTVNLQSSLALFERIFGYLDISPEIADSPGAIDVSPDTISGLVSFESVSMNYDSVNLKSGLPEDDSVSNWALQDVSLEIKPGHLVALVGPSGAGKTTISYLLPRLYDPTTGVIRIDGYDVKDISLISLSKIIGYVSQESYLFHASIKDNLLYGKPDATDQEIYDAARAANIHDRIMEFPDQYDTIVGERGYRISGGERQRLSIGRVILHQPKILILDEATSALDTGSERLVQAALQPLMRNRTTIAIAHRLSTVLAADVIYVIDRGKIVESGNHSDLVSRKGLYCSLYRQQFLDPRDRSEVGLI